MISDYCELDKPIYLSEAVIEDMITRAKEGDIGDLKLISNHNEKYLTICK